MVGVRVPCNIQVHVSPAVEDDLEVALARHSISYVSEPVYKEA